jgi:tRNA(Ile)-lysidine synthase
LRVVRRDVPAERRRGESSEVAARRVRYEVLEEVRAETGATRIVTAHQRDDQVETVLLRLLAGSGLEGLAGIPERRGALLRPILSVPRRAIEAFLAEARIEPVRDPTNRDLSVRRNLLRHELLPRLAAEAPGLDAVVLSLRDHSVRMRSRLDAAFATHFREASIEGGLARERLLAVPAILRPAALRWSLRTAGVSPPPSSPSLEAFLAGIASRGRGRLELPGGGRALLARGGRVTLAVPKPPLAPFSYTFELPGEVELVELGLRLRVRRSAVEPWMFRGEPGRTALAGQAAAFAVATVRGRRPGDRLRPLGAPGSRKLKELLIDRGVPAERRELLPILELDGRIAWVPGVAIDEAFRLRGERECWVAELAELDRGGNGPPGGPVERVEKEPS